MIGCAILPDKPVDDPGEFTPPPLLVAGEISRWHHLLDLSAVDRPHEQCLLRVRPDMNCKVWIYGYVTYTDQFARSRKRTCRWAREYDPILSKNRPASDGSYPMLFAHLAKPKYNYAD